MIITAPLAGILEIALPFIVAVWFISRYKTTWRLFWIGMLIFIASQVIHIPVLQWVTSLFTQGLLPTPPQEWLLLTNAVILGLLAGLAEETARLVGFKLLKDQGRSWAKAVTLGLGHGGIECVVIGLTTIVNYGAMVIGRSHPAFFNLPTDQLPALQAQVQTYWSYPWYMGLAGLVERMGTLPLQVALTVIVYQVFARRNALYYFLAVLIHALVDAIAVYATGMGWNVWLIEGIVVLFGLISLGIIVFYKRKEDTSIKNEESLTAPN